MNRLLLLFTAALTFLTALSAVAVPNPLPQPLGALTVYRNQAGDSLVPDRLGIAAPLEHTYPQVVPLRLKASRDPESDTVSGVYLQPGTNEVFLMADYKMQIKLGTVKLPLAETALIEPDADFSGLKYVEEVRPLQLTANPNRPTGCRVFEVTAVLRGKRTLSGTWPPGSYTAQVANELYHCSSLSYLGGSWEILPPTPRWYVIGFY